MMWCVAKRGAIGKLEWSEVIGWSWILKLVLHME